MNQENSPLGISTIRRNRGMSLEQIALSTKISVRALEAIERGDFAKLPGGIYSTSYIRQYARAIGYDEAALLDYYNRQIAPSAPPGGRESTNRVLDLFRPASPVAGS